MNSNARLIMETWRRFLKEDPLMDKQDTKSEVVPEVGYCHGDYNDGLY